MKKLSKQAVTSTQSPAPPSGHGATKKKAKTASTSFTPYHKSSTTHSEINLPLQRYSVGQTDTPLAINQNGEYFASGNQGATPSAQAHRLIVQQMSGKPSHSQLAPCVGGTSEHQGGPVMPAGTQSTKHTKVSTLKNKAAFENFHPSQQLGQIGDITSPHQLQATAHKLSSSIHSTNALATSQMLHATAGGTSAMSKLSHYQKMSSTSGHPSQKRAYVRGSSKKGPGTASLADAANSMALHHQLHPKISTSIHHHQNHMDDKVKKSSSQSLIKMQAAQMISASQLKDFQGHNNGPPGERKSTFKSSALSKKAQDAHALASGKLESSATTTKKLIFSFKKNDKQKVTPPNLSAPKPGTVGHHRRVQSHGTQSAQMSLKTEQPSNKVHSPKVEKASVMEMFGSDKTSTVQPSVTNETISHTLGGGGGPGHAQSQLIGGAHPALTKSHKGDAGNNKSKASVISHSSLNGSREQVSIISLNSFSRSTPKFTQVLSLPTSAINYQASLSRMANFPAKMLSPQSQTQVKQSQITPAKSISIKDKKVTNGSVPSDGLTGGAGTKKASKMSKHQKLRLKHAQSTVQPAVSGNFIPSSVRHTSPDATNKRQQQQARAEAAASKGQNLPRFDSKQVSSRNQEKERMTRSTGSIKEPSSLIQSGNASVQFQSNRPTIGRQQDAQNRSVKDYQDLEAVGEEFPDGPTNGAQVHQEPNQQKMPSGPHHQKSNSMPQAQISSPGIYNMYMGQVKQLKKQRITLNKGAMANNTQPTHYINLNSESQMNLIQSHASLESLKKSTALLPSGGQKPKMSVTGKAPVKLHLTMPPSAHLEKSHLHAENTPLQDSTSHEHDMPTTEPSNRPLVNQVPVSLTNMQSQGLAQKHFQSMRSGQTLTNSISAVNMPGSLMSSSQPRLGTLSPHAANQHQPPQKSLTIKHKQLAKAIKQHHQNMVRHTGDAHSTGYTPITAKTLSNSNQMGRLGEDTTHVQKQLIRSTISPKQLQQTHSSKAHSSTVSAPHQMLSSPAQQHSQQIFNQLGQDLKKQQQQQADQFMSERRSTTVNNPLEAHTKCWIQPEATSSIASDDRIQIREYDYIQNDPSNRVGQGSGPANMVSQDTVGSNPQQISAAIIKKIQNNYQVQVTNTGYDSAMTTASAQALNSITQKIKNENSSVLPYLHALQEICEVYAQNQALNTLLSQIHQGISTLILSKEDQIQQSHAEHSNTNKLIQAKEQELKQAQEHIQHLERNEQETRRCVQQMTEQIDERDYKIDKLEHKIMEHQKRARLMFKKQMATPQERLKVDLLFDGNCSELEKQSDEHRKVFQENEELQAAIDELNEDMAYGKQRENKLMFFLYILKQMGYPISEVFEREIKDVPTSRFSKNFDDEYKVMHAQLWKERKEAKKEAKLVSQNGFGIDRDEILIESVPKSDRLVPLEYGRLNISARLDSQQSVTVEDEEDINFQPLQMGPTLMPDKPEIVPYLDINKVLIIKYRRAKGLSVSNLINRNDSMEQQSQSSEESLDSRGRPKRCPKPRLHKKIMDQYGISTGARNILALESKICRQKYDEIIKNRSNTRTSNFETYEEMEDELRFTLNSYRADSIQSQRI